MQEDQTASRESPVAPVPVINLAEAPGQRESWDKPRVVHYLWAAVEIVILYNPWQISSSLRVVTLRAFGAHVGEGVIIRPRTRIKNPWKLSVGDRSWVGEGAWIHNQDFVEIGHDVVVSQEAFITTGSHKVRKDMGLITKHVVIEEGVWLATRSMILGGSVVGRSSIVAPNVVIPANSEIPPNSIVEASKIAITRKRFEL